MAPLARHLLRNEVLAALKSSIARGAWKNSLPSERQLTGEYQVSRGTLRYALKILQQEGIIEAKAGSGYQIVKKLDAEQVEPASVSIGILIGTPDASQTSSDLSWIAPLQQRVAKRGWHIHVHEGILEINRSPAIGLKKLFNATSHSGWLLVRCPEKVQAYFMNNGPPAVICGSPFPGIDLPSFDIDYRATGRHAAGMLASKGHQRIGFVCRRDPFPGDEKLYEGLMEGARTSSTSLRIKKIRHPDTRYDYSSTLRQVQQSHEPLTALFIDSPFHFLSIYNQAPDAGIRIPEDLSLLCRNDATFLQFLKPSPSFYQFNPQKMANKIHRLIEARVQGDPLKGQRTLVLPEFVSGQSIIQITKPKN